MEAERRRWLFHDLEAGCVDLVELFGSFSRISTMTLIVSLPLYPREDGVAWIRRRENAAYSAVGEWPTLEVGQHLEIHDTQGWQWQVTVSSIINPDHAEVVVIGDRVALPLPPLQNNHWVRLPNIGGHAHLRSWQRGDIIREWGSYYKVTKVRPEHRSGKIVYEIELSSEEAYTTRPGRVSFASESSRDSVVGSAVQTKSGEWLHIKSTSRSQFNGAMGRGHTYYGEGRFVSAEKAAKINAKHPLLLDAALSNLPAKRVDSMPAGAVQLKPKNISSLAATGSRVAVVGSTIYHERTGDPDRTDGWYHYAVTVEGSPELLKQVKDYVKSASKATK